MHEHIELFTYLFFNKYTVRQLYHMYMDYFSSHEDHCNLIEYMLQGFVVFDSSNLNPSGLFMYISLFMDPYKYVFTASVRLTSSPSETIRVLSYKCQFLYPTSFILLDVLTAGLKNSHFINK